MKAAILKGIWNLQFLSHIRDFPYGNGQRICFCGKAAAYCYGKREDYFIDLVFYNIELKCYVLVDLKMGKITIRMLGDD